MKRGYSLFTIIIAGAALLAFSGLISAAAMVNAASTPESCEEQGLEYGRVSSSVIDKDRPPVILESLPDSADVLLIPESGDDYVGIYDPMNGNFLGIFISDFPSFSTPICAMAGPDDNIYVSDQVADAVFVFDRDGNYLETYADASDGLNNVRGIDFFEGHLFVTSGDDYVAEFDAPHSRLADFINDGTDPFDIYFMEDGSALLTDIQGSTDNVRVYSPDGTFHHEIFSVSFPEQVNVDLHIEGGYLNNSFSGDMVTFFDVENMHSQIPWDAGRGVFRLGNGNILVTNSDGVFEINPDDGTIIEQKNTGSARFIELIPALIPTDVGDNNSAIPTNYALSGNYPNPFNASTLIKYELPSASEVTIDIYDILGRKVTTIVNGMQPAGYHQVLWDADTSPSGVYFYKISAGDFSDSKKMMLIK